MDKGSLLLDVSLYLSFWKSQRVFSEIIRILSNYVEQVNFVEYELNFSWFFVLESKIRRFVFNFHFLLENQILIRLWYYNYLNYQSMFTNLRIKKQETKT